MRNDEKLKLTKNDKFQKIWDNFFRPFFDKSTYFRHKSALENGRRVKICLRGPPTIYLSRVKKIKSLLACPYKWQRFQTCTTAYYSIFSPKISHISALESCRRLNFLGGPPNIYRSRVKNQVSICFLSRMAAF